MDTTNTISEAITSATNETIVKQTFSIVNWFKSLLTLENLFKLSGSLLIIFVFWLIYKIIIKITKKIPQEKVKPQKIMILQRFIKYLFFIAVAMYVLSLFGVKLSAIWGAAGIAGVAIGFAAQTSVSNLISGLFVLTEGSIHVGDTIIVDGITGIVDEVNLLSVRIHTFDNQMVRIPNSTIINNNLINNSYHDKRRITVTLSVDYNSDLEKTLSVLIKAAELCPTVLKNPAPDSWVEKCTNSGIEITVAAWFKPIDYIQTKNDLHISVLKELKKSKITIPYPKLNVSLEKEQNKAIKK